MSDEIIKISPLNVLIIGITGFIIGFFMPEVLNLIIFLSRELSNITGESYSTFIWPSLFISPLVMHIGAAALFNRTTLKNVVIILRQVVLVFCFGGIEVIGFLVRELEDDLLSFGTHFFLLFLFQTVITLITIAVSDYFKSHRVLRNLVDQSK